MYTRVYLCMPVYTHIYPCILYTSVSLCICAYLCVGVYPCMLVYVCVTVVEYLEHWTWLRVGGSNFTVTTGS